MLKKFTLIILCKFEMLSIPMIWKMLTLLMWGHNVPHFFQKAISPWKKGSGGPKFLNFSQFIINFQKIKKKFGFKIFLGWSRRWGHILGSIPALKKWGSGSEVKRLMPQNTGTSPWRIGSIRPTGSSWIEGNFLLSILHLQMNRK